MNTIYTTDDVIRIFGIHRNSVTNWVRNGRLTPISGKDSKPFFFKATQLRKLLERLKRLPKSHGARYKDVSI